MQQFLNKMSVAAIFFGSLVVSGHAMAATCKIIADCGGEEYPFGVVDAETGDNILGQCHSKFEHAFKNFINLRQTGQCDAARTSPDCEIVRSSRDWLAIVDKKTQESVFNRVYSSLDGAFEVLRALRATGQCSRVSEGSPCSIDGRCHHPDNKYRVFYSETQKNFTGICYYTIDDAMKAFVKFRDFGQCSKN